MAKDSRFKILILSTVSQIRLFFVSLENLLPLWWSSKHNKRCKNPDVKIICSQTRVTTLGESNSTWSWKSAWLTFLASKHFCLVFFGLSLSCSVGIPSWFEISDAKSGIVTSGLNIYKSLGHAVNPQLDTRKNFFTNPFFPLQKQKRILMMRFVSFSLSSAITSLFASHDPNSSSNAMTIGLP